MERRDGAGTSWSVVASAQPTPGRCNRKGRNGYCEKWPVKGAKVCATHGGSAPQVKRAARERQVRQEALARAQRMVTRAGVHLDPIEHLLDSLHLAAQLMHVWGAMVAAIDAKAAEETEANGVLRGELGYDEVESEQGFTDLIVKPHDRLMAVNSKGEARIHPYVEEYQRALERRAKFAKLCIDAGVEERRVRAAERAGEAMAELIRGVLTDLGIPLNDPKTRDVVTRRLALIEGGGQAAA